MIHFKENIKQHEAQYILEEVLPKRGWRISNQTLAYWEKAHNIMFQEQVGIPGCSCEYVATYNVWKSRVEQYEQQLRDIAYPPVQISPSEIIVEAITEIQTSPNEISVKTTKGRKSKNA